jgi:hypothetical protein
MLSGNDMRRTAPSMPLHHASVQMVRAICTFFQGHAFGAPSRPIRGRVLSRGVSLGLVGSYPERDAREIARVTRAPNSPTALGQRWERHGSGRAQAGDLRCGDSDPMSALDLAERRYLARPTDGTPCWYLGTKVLPRKRGFRLLQA